ncbi:hypothetical protein ASPBRDRAFT_616465 [Aspergillus brasiliensis CBS 101740]|uniref:Uncharacterized protein n=1 Tax=Aspergillus brasiliensis (strain CBS 101740 / IMI 381727 / IBT 21946) TaxID=767769 RepID=A0A1L9UF44_ASPBC|nr:hypothetical protein ASPBRDRAFT_616465 [Aspergillus brasiliensis CBS 101740]
MRRARASLSSFLSFHPLYSSSTTISFLPFRSHLLSRRHCSGYPFLSAHSTTLVHSRVAGSRQWPPIQTLRKAGGCTRTSPRDAASVRPSRSRSRNWPHRLLSTNNCPSRPDNTNARHPLSLTHLSISICLVSMNWTNEPEQPAIGFSGLVLRRTRRTGGSPIAVTLHSSI